MNIHSISFFILRMKGRDHKNALLCHTTHFLCLYFTCYKVKLLPGYLFHVSMYV